MPTALVLSDPGPDAPDLAGDLADAGITVLAETSCPNMLHDVVKNAPDVVVVRSSMTNSALFDAIQAVNTAAPRPIVLFTTDPDAGQIATAVQRGVHAYIVDGYARARLRSVLHLAQARFTHDQALRTELAEVNQRFAERTLVDRAKGILMGARGVREDEAYRALRSAAMAGKQRIGQVAQEVIEGARYGEAVNRAGQLRMLSQRLVKLYALACCGVDPAGTARLSAESLAAGEANLAALARNLSKPTLGDLLDAVARPWAALRDALSDVTGGTPDAGRLRALDALAEDVLRQAERLTANLEVAAFATALHVINAAGRQRMLSQRLVKEALLATLPGGPRRAAGQKAQAELEAGLAALAALPMTNADITAALAAATACWDGLRDALRQVGTPVGQARIAGLSEELLTRLDRLTDLLERGMQAMAR